ncbi:MAG: hypothetical protein Q4F66_00750 [Clostridium sp.]|nr:hypothetical protein [Clostridium sp.]
MNARLVNIFKILFAMIYAIGITCVLIFGITYLQHSSEIPYPDSMLSMMKYEMAAWRLIIGIPFMAASCISIILVNKIRSAKQIVLILLPLILCLLLSINYFIASP